jgi:hypothetical protein
VDGKHFYITDNLCAALRALRLPDRDRFLWIDAICINQYDGVEKGSQVQMMRDIYAGATRTIVWLGEASERTHLLTSVVARFGTTETGDRVQI